MPGQLRDWRGLRGRGGLGVRVRRGWYESRGVGNRRGRRISLSTFPAVSAVLRTSRKVWGVRERELGSDGPSALSVRL